MMPVWLHVAMPFVFAGIGAAIGGSLGGGDWAIAAALIGFISGVTITNILDGTRSNIGLLERLRR